MSGRNRAASRPANGWPGALLLAAMTAASPAFAATGGLDTSFGDGGLVEVASPLGHEDIAATAVIEQGDGKIVAAGYSQQRGGQPQLLLVRFDSSGVLDETFGNGGFATGQRPGDQAASLIQQADGKLVVAGSSAGELAFWRFGADGTADAGFGVGGAVYVDTASDEAWVSGGLAETSAGVLVAPVSTTINYDYGEMLLVGVSSEGRIDTGFGEQGIAQLGPGFILAVGSQPDGRIIVLGSREYLLVVLRVLAEGTLDTSFGNDGFAGIETPHRWIHDGDVAVRGDDSILVAAHLGVDGWFYSDGQGLLVRLLPDGAIDHAFGDGGSVVTPLERGDHFTSVVAIEDDIFVGGNYVTYPSPPDQTIAWDLAVSKFDSGGSPDGSFGTNGRWFADFGTAEQKRYSFAFAMAPQSDGRVVLAGTSFPTRRLALARFRADASDAPGTIRALVPEGSGGEDSGMVRIVLQRSGGAAGPAVVNFATGSGTATEGEDFPAQTGRIEWGDGDAADKFVKIEVIDDTLWEGEEDFWLRLTAAGGAAKVTRELNRVTILDNEARRQPDAGAAASDILDRADTSGGGATGALFLVLLGAVLAGRSPGLQNVCVKRA